MVGFKKLRNFLYLKELRFLWLKLENLMETFTKVVYSFLKGRRTTKRTYDSSGVAIRSFVCSFTPDSVKKSIEPLLRHRNSDKINYFHVSPY